MRRAKTYNECHHDRKLFPGDCTDIRYVHAQLEMIVASHFQTRDANTLKNVRILVWSQIDEVLTHPVTMSSPRFFHWCQSVVSFEISLARHAYTDDCRGLNKDIFNRVVLNKTELNSQKDSCRNRQ